MKFSSIATGIALAIAGVAAQVTSPMQDYNVTSPASNYPYVAGQVLPCTWQIFSTVNSALALTISLKSTAAGSNTTFTISGGADVSKTSASEKVVNNVTVYEHTYNYNIPTTAPTGAYNVVFLDTTTNTETNIPITVLPVASSSVVAAASATGTGSSAAATSTSPQNVYKNGVESMSPSKVGLALGAVAAIAYAL